MRICPIILNYKTPNETIECISSVLRGSRLPSELVIVDNNSNDQSLNVIKDYLTSISTIRQTSSGFGGTTDFCTYKTTSSTIYLIASTSNLGYAAGNLLGIDAARALVVNIDYYWILNSDTTLRIDSLAKLDYFLNNNSGFDLLGTTIVDVLSNTIQSCGGGFDLYTGRAKHLKEGEPVCEAVGVDGIMWATYPVGASMVVSQKLSVKHDWMRKDLFLYYEEINIVVSRGKPYIVPIIADVIVEHKCGASTGFSRDTKERPPWLEYYLYRNKLLTAHALGWGYVFMYLLASIFGLLKRFSSYNLGQIKYSILGILHGIKGRAGKLNGELNNIIN
jgi:GT2 family glycosyltransferase